MLKEPLGFRAEFAGEILKQDFGKAFGKTKFPKGNDKTLRETALTTRK